MDSIRPDHKDIESVIMEYGRLPDDATDEQLAHQYRLAQATSLLRLIAAAGATREPRRRR